MFTGTKYCLVVFWGFFCCRLVSAWVLENKDSSMHLKDAHSGSEANILCYGPTGARERKGNSVVGLKCLAVKSPNTSK